MRPLEKLISLVSLAAICAGAAYAYNRESLRETNLNPVFQEINREYFAGELSGVRVAWDHLDQERGETRKFGEGDILILVDQGENTSLADVRETLQHEACHVLVDWQELDKHGPMFQACMERF